LVHFPRFGMFGPRKIWQPWARPEPETVMIGPPLLWQRLPPVKDDASVAGLPDGIFSNQNSRFG
jgi:hypothetical protein